MCGLIHAPACASTYMRAHPRTCAPIHAGMHLHAHLPTCACINALAPASTYLLAHLCTCMRIHAPTCTSTHLRAHPRTCVLIHAPGRASTHLGAHPRAHLSYSIPTSISDVFAEASVPARSKRDVQLDDIRRRKQRSFSSSSSGIRFPLQIFTYICVNTAT